MYEAQYCGINHVGAGVRIITNMNLEEWRKRLHGTAWISSFILFSGRLEAIFEKETFVPLWKSKYFIYNFYICPLCVDNLPYLLTYLQSWALLEEPPIGQPLKNFLAFYGTQRWQHKIQAGLRAYLHELEAYCKFLL
jgi:hypothetical protein